MAWDVIRKQSAAERATANLADYDAARAAFTWEAARAELEMPGGLNIAYHALDRHVAEGRGGKLALRWLGKGGERRDFTYRELLSLSNRFANLLRDLGVGRGDRVFSLLGRIPELYIAALGALRNGSVFSPLFSAFGPEPVRTRMAIGDAKVSGDHGRLLPAQSCRLAQRAPRIGACTADRSQRRPACRRRHRFR